MPPRLTCPRLTATASGFTLPQPRPGQHRPDTHPVPPGRRRAVAVGRPACRCRRAAEHGWCELDDPAREICRAGPHRRGRGARRPLHRGAGIPVRRGGAALAGPARAALLRAASRRSAAGPRHPAQGSAEPAEPAGAARHPRCRPAGPGHGGFPAGPPRLARGRRFGAARLARGRGAAARLGGAARPCRAARPVRHGADRLGLWARQYRR